VLVGSGWGIAAYPDSLWSSNSIDLFGPIQFGADMLGPSQLNAEGYNVITWDNRGWYGSGGQINIDSPQVEGRDVTALINWLATLPGAKLKGPNDPVVGMTGASYGGGIQLSAAGIDHRIDAIEPNMSWYSLMDSLYPNQVIKAGWGNLLCLAGQLAGAGNYNPAPEEAKLCASAQSGNVSQDEINFGIAASPSNVISQITTPTLLLGGTVDTLFPLNGDVQTYEALRAAGTPVKMIWYCGGHGLCEYPFGDDYKVVNEELAFFAKYLKGQNVSLGPGFEYVDQTGFWRSAPAYPVPVTGHLQATSIGSLHLSPNDSSGLAGIVAGVAFNAFNVRIPAPQKQAEVLTDPQLTLTYQGTADRPTAPVFAQLLDNATLGVLDNQATPILLTLDGQIHTVTVPLNMVAWNLGPWSNVSLQLTDASDLFFGQRATGTVGLKATIALSTSTPGPTG
jgi:ABC-2 type transport system ATP-binding protein